MSILVSPHQRIYSTAFHWQDGRGEAFELRFLGSDELPGLVTFRDMIFAGLSDIDAYYPEVPEFVGWHMDERGKTLGVWCQNRLVACAVLGIPLTGMPNFADDLPDLNINPLSVAHMCSCMVDPQWRGHGLQRLLVSMRVMLAVGLGRPHLLTRVAVINHVSLANMFATDFVLRRIIVMHGTRLRYVLHRDLAAAPMAWDAAAAVAVPLADTDRQRAALANGLCGVGLAGPANDRHILFIPDQGISG